MRNITKEYVIKLAKKIHKGCERTAYIKKQALKADLYLTIHGLRDMKIETEENCFAMLSDIFGSVIDGEV